MADENVLGPIAEAFSGKPSADRWQEAVKLAQSDDPKMLADIETGLHAAEYDFRRAAIYALGLRGSRGAERLIEIAYSSLCPRNREYALMVLSYNAPNDSAAEAVIAASVDDRDPRVRLMTREFLAFNLFAVAKRDPRPRLRELIREGGFRQRWRALRAYRRVREHGPMLQSVQLSGWRRAIWLKYRHATTLLRDRRTREEE